MPRLFLRAIAFAFPMILATTLSALSVSAGEFSSRFSGATGGIIRFPNDLQPKNKGNLFGEGWVKLSFSLHKTERTNTAVFVLGSLVADSAGFSYNNTNRLSVGLLHSMQISDALNVTLSAKYEWYHERMTGERRDGFKLAADYYYYRRWEAEPDARMFGLQKTATVFKSYGTLAFPGSLVKGDSNVVLTIGGEYSADLKLGSETKWLLTPFADFDLAWDKDRNNYNNKAVLGVGIKARYPLKKGEIFAGVRLSGDYRPMNETFHAGPAAFAGWYIGF